MKTIKELCKPRDSVFSDTVRDDVLNLSDLVEGRIDADHFFEENFKTKGMELLFDTAFKRFAGKSQTGVIKLTQAMGGGKTHNMLALALLAQNLDWRKKVLGKEYHDIKDIKVVAFSGRESDTPFGIWGSIAEQLGRKEFFKDHYSPLKAPGETAWINLLKGQRILILLDELPPYLENARSMSIGQSDLCTVTITALSNLFIAIGKGDLANVCLVISDLRATYTSGSQALASSFKELESEVDRTALSLDPIALNTDEVYDVLCKRLFTEYPNEKSPAVNEIAVSYKEALTQAGKSELTSYTGNAVYLGINDSYPFHPSIKEIYARFKENQGFQQTRGLIKLMRQVVRGFFERGEADTQHLINVFDIDLNNPQMLSVIKQIKPSLDTAISHDIAQNGKAVAEIIDQQNSEAKQNYAQDVAKLLLMSSLNDTPHGMLGLLESDILGYLCKPGTDLNSYKKVLDDIITQCWYVKTDNRGHIYFQNTKNITANLNDIVNSYSNESAKKDLRAFLENSFEPKLKKCYEKVFALPAIDEINIEQGRLSLIIFEPHSGTDINPELKNFYDNCKYPNRVLFLSGQRNVMEKLYANAKRLSAIKHIIAEMKADHTPETDQQFKEADRLFVKATNALITTIRETFITLYYPTKNGLSKEDILLEFTENKFVGEEQIINTLGQSRAMKFFDFSAEDDFIKTHRGRLERDLFTVKEMPWSQILERAATVVAFPWYHPKQLDEIRKKSIQYGVWKETGGYIVKGPFEKEPTSVRIEQTSYDEKTGYFSLKITPIRGDRVFYEFGAEPTQASNEVRGQTLPIKEPSALFICYDTTDTENPHPTGQCVKWTGEVPLKREQRQNADGSNIFQLQSHPAYEIRYTTDGSNPKESGGIYTGDIVLHPDCRFVRTATYYKGELISTEDIPIETKTEEVPKLEIDDATPLSYTYNAQKKCKDTQQTYSELANLKQITDVSISHFTVIICEKECQGNYLEITSAKIPCNAENLQAMIDLTRDSAFADKDVEIELAYKAIHFKTGSLFKHWVDENKLDARQLQYSGSIKQ